MFLGTFGHLCLVQAVQEKELQGQRGGVEAELAEVQPLIDQARKAVGQVRPGGD